MTGAGLEVHHEEFKHKQKMYLLHSVSSAEPHHWHDRSPECYVLSASAMRRCLFHYKHTYRPVSNIVSYQVSHYQKMIDSGCHDKLTSMLITTTHSSQ